jgi:hypothetical protein
MPSRNNESVAPAGYHTPIPVQNTVAILGYQNSLQATNFLYIKQYSNQSGLMEHNSGVRLPLPT